MGGAGIEDPHVKMRLGELNMCVWAGSSDSHAKSSLDIGRIVSTHSGGTWQTPPYPMTKVSVTRGKSCGEHGPLKGWDEKVLHLCGLLAPNL